MRSCGACLLPSLFAALLAAQETQQPEKQQPEKQQPEKQQPEKQPEWLQAGRPPDAKTLFAALGRLPGLEASYSEAKHLALLAAPLRSSGKLYYLPPGYLLRQVDKPERATLRITPKELRLEDKDGSEVIDLRQSERLRLFVGSLVDVFRGDLAALQRSYTVEYTPSKDDPRGWQLTLVPRDPRLSQMLQQLQLAGEGLAVRRIEVLEPNGDRTVTTITAADPQRQFTAAERRELFGVEPPPKAR